MERRMLTENSREPSTERCARETAFVAPEEKPDETMNEEMYSVANEEPAWMEQHMRPDCEDCTDGTVPDRTESTDGKKKLLVPEDITMTKYLFEHHRLTMYSFLNRCLRDGSLSKTVGFRVLNKVINRNACDFRNVSFWKIDRESFIAAVLTELKLNGVNGPKTWSGYLVLWCSFEDRFICTVEELTQEINFAEEGYDHLSPFLVPYYKNKRVDEVTEQIWRKYLPAAIQNPEARSAAELAKRMGLSIQYHPVYDHKGVDSILFFIEDDLDIGEDRIEKHKDGTKKRIRDGKPGTIRIPANTIVVNTNLIKRDYSAYNIYHECFHYDQHYLFFRLQQMNDNDTRKMRLKEVEMEKGKELNDPVYFMEKQANRGAYGLMMPASNTRQLIAEEGRKVEKSRHFGEHYEAIGKAISRRLSLPHFRVRARMIQLGHVQAKGALNYVERELIQPFAFDTDAWREEQHTFVVDWATVVSLCKNNDDFRALMDSGKYTYADGHVVRNDPRFVCEQSGRLLLTEWANAHVDDCCLRFVRLYVQEYVGRYVFGRMYYDAEYVRRSQFYLNDLINERHLDELDAKTEYIRTFPRNFKDAIEQLRKQNGLSIATLAEELSMDDRTLSRWLSEPTRYRNEDFLTILCLIMQLPDWISNLVFRRAAMTLDGEDKRHQALEHILRVQSCDGIAAANEYLTRLNLPNLSI